MWPHVHTIYLDPERLCSTEKIWFDNICDLQSCKTPVNICNIELCFWYLIYSISIVSWMKHKQGSHVWFKLFIKSQHLVSIKTVPHQLFCARPGHLHSTLKELRVCNIVLIITPLVLVCLEWFWYPSKARNMSYIMKVQESHFFQVQAAYLSVHGVLEYKIEWINNVPWKQST